MANHLRQQIRDALKAKLIGLPITGSNVFGRGNPLCDDQLPALRIKTMSEAIGQRAPVDEDDGVSRLSLRKLVFEIEAILKTSADVENGVDAATLAVEQAISTDRRLGGLARDLRLMNTDIQDDFAGEMPAVVGKLTIEVDYLCDESAPTAAIA